MVEHTHRLAAWSLALAMVAGPIVTAPVAAQPADEVTPAAGINADRVDGKHAISATGKAKRRANKLVATNKQGLLPSNILRPLWSLLQGIPAVLADGQVSWGEIIGLPTILADGQVGWGEVQGIPAGFADGVDNVGTTGYVTATAPCDGPINAGGEYVSFRNLPRNMVHDFQVVPTGGGGDWLYIERIEAWDNGDGTVDIDVRIEDLFDSGAQTCNVRRISFTDGISVAKAKKQLKKVTIAYPKKKRSR
jgi:hypothetical protein